MICVLRLDCTPTGQILCLMFCVAPITLLEFNKRSITMVLWLSEYKKNLSAYFCTYGSRPLYSELVVRVRVIALVTKRCVAWEESEETSCVQLWYAQGVFVAAEWAHTCHFLWWWLLRVPRFRNCGFTWRGFLSQMHVGHQYSPHLLPCRTWDSAWNPAGVEGVGMCAAKLHISIRAVKLGGVAGTSSHFPLT